MLLAGVLVTSAVALGACGSSGGGSGGGASGSGTGTSGTAGAAIPSPSTLVNSPTYRQHLIYLGIHQHAQSPAFAAKLANCIISKFEADGFKTAGEANAHLAQAHQAGFACGAQLAGGK